MAEKIIYVIDDESGIRSFFESFLSFKGFTPRTFSTGTEALEKLAEGERPDAVLCDCFGKNDGRYGGININLFYENAKAMLGDAVRYAMTGTPFEVKNYWGDLSQFGVKRMFIKPFDGSAILSALEEDLGEDEHLDYIATE